MFPHDSFKRAIADRYGFDRWPHSDSAHRKFLPRIDARHGLTFHRRVPLEGRHAFTDHYLGNDDVHVMITVIGYGDAAQAHEALLERLARAMATNIPRCEEKGLEVGDVCFCSVRDDPFAVVLFVRGNVLVAVENGGPRLLSLAELARDLDEQLLSSP